MGLRHSRVRIGKHAHTIIKSEENGIDPDDGNTWMCSACTLPIFSTPFKNIRGRLLHDQCANLPSTLEDHVLHRGKVLTLKDKPFSYRDRECDKCKATCGDRFYKCLTYSCRLRLDLLCSVQINILHRSHEHRLMAVRASAYFNCGACKTQHEGRPSSPSYLCTTCDFWIHRECASSPNAIRLVQPEHQHSLFLAHDLAPSSTEGWKCAICREKVDSLGVYICSKCGFYAHVTCATSDPDKFKPVKIRDAKLADLLHLPMPDEGSCIVQCILMNTSIGDDVEASVLGGGRELPAVILHYDDEDEEKETEKNEGKKNEKETEKELEKALEKKKDTEKESKKTLENELEKKEEKADDEKEANDPNYGHNLSHRLILHDNKHDDDGVDSDDDDGTGHSSSRVCNACVQFISGPPFYSCSECPDYLLHSSCAHLPPKIQHPFHKEHALSLSVRALKKFSSEAFDCIGCNRKCSGFAYSCKTCKVRLDVLCALMPALITHASHGKTHILYMSSRRLKNIKCSCCNLNLEGMFYECTNCRLLKLHAHCALLPTTITHSFDAHPLKLTTTSRTSDESQEKQHICEVCEEDIDKIMWYYSCSSDCDQSFHINCIPFLDSHSRIKFGVTANIRSHNCPITLVRESAVAGYSCQVCEHKLKYNYNPSKPCCAYECSKCNYKIHETCAI